MDRQTYQIGAFRFALAYETPEDRLPIPANFKKFICEDAPADYTYRLRAVDEILPPQAQPICVRPELLVFSGDAGEMRYLFFAGSREPYGSYQEEASGAFVQIRRDCLRLCEIDTVFTSLFALERHLLWQDTLILHCAALDVGGESLLLSGPSGIGKSTHAALWERYADAKQVNGDRILMQRTAKGWQTLGCPICGSSGICENRTLPLGALVFLSQSPVNGGERLTPAKALRKIVSQTMANRWNPDAVARAWDLAQALALEIPVYAYGCNMEPDAVNVLQELRKQ
jgi:hypothetical protein